jgi:thiol-disulfide isomerase/thioredoxin
MMTTRHFLPVLLAALAFTQAAPAAGLGDPAPALAINQWIKGKPVDLTKGKGTNLFVVEFWATWCPPCRTTIPYLTELQKKLKDKGVVIIGISDEAVEKVKPFVASMTDQMDYIVAVDDNQKTAAAYMQAFGVGTIPHAFVVDKSGAVAWHGSPMMGLDKALEDMLAGTYDIETPKRMDRIERTFQQYFTTLVTTGQRSPEVDKLGNEVVMDAAKLPNVLNQFAWIILTDQRIKDRDLDLALRASKLSYDVTGGKDVNAIRVRAQALFSTGKIDEAIKTLKEAVAFCSDASCRSQIESELQRYETKAKEQKPAVSQKS